MFYKSRGLALPSIILLAVAVLMFTIAVSGCNEKQSKGSSAETSKSESDQANSKGSTNKNNGNQKNGNQNNGQNANSGQSQKTATIPTTTQKQQQSTSKNKSGKIMLFDTAHGEIFNLNDDKQMGYTKMRDLITARGYAVETNRSLFKDGAFTGADVVVLAGPMSKLNPQETELLIRYVKEGGNLIITVHVSHFLTDLANALGIQLSTGVLGQMSGSFEGQVKNFVASGTSKHPVTDGVKGIALRGTWALQPLQGNTYDVSTIISTASDAWVDINSNDMYDIGEPRGAYGVIGVSAVEKGKVIIICDDAVFTNFTIDMADNHLMLENIINWFES